MWPKKKFWWETGGTPPQQSPNPEARVFAGNPMHQWRLGMKMPTVPLRTFDEWDVRRGHSPRFSADTRPGFGDIRQASQTPTAPFGGGIGKSAYQGVGSKKKGNKLKYIVEALREMEGETPGPLPGRDRVGGTRPGMPGYTPTNMGAYVDNPVATQAALAEARRKKEKEGLMNLLHGGYV